MLGVFRVILKLQELFNGGVVRLSEGPGAYRLYQYDRKKVLRISGDHRTDASLSARLRLHQCAGPPPALSCRNSQFHTLFNTSHSTRRSRVSSGTREISEVVREHAI